MSGRLYCLASTVSKSCWSSATSAAAISVFNHPAVRQIREACVADHVARVARDHQAAGVPLVRGQGPPGEVLQDVRPTYGSLTGKKQGGHFGVEPHAHAKPCEKLRKLFHVSCKKTSCSTCHAKNKLFHMSCHAKKPRAKPCKKTSCSTCHAKTMQKPCKNHAKCGAYGVPTRRTLTVPRVLAIRAICAIWVSQGKPLNIHSSPGPCYMCYMCYMALTRQATEPHSPPAPCSMYYMCYMGSLFCSHTPARSVLDFEV